MSTMCTQKARIFQLIAQVCLFTIGLIGVGAAAEAQVTLNFNDLPNPNSGTGFNGQSVANYQGFTLTDTGSTFGGLHSVSPDGASGSGGSYNYTGSVALFNGADGGADTLTQDNSNPFRILSIDIANLVLQSSSPGGVTVQFTGTLAGGGTVTQSFTHAANDSLTTVTFDSSFSNLNAFTISQGGLFNQYDNIVIAGPAAGNTPEPGSVALLSVMATCGLALRRYRRRKA